MEFRKAVTQDIPDITRVIEQAKVYLRGMGVNQWQNGYPNADTIAHDIEKGCSYVLTDEGHIIGSVALTFDVEVPYEKIEGKWMSDGQYAVIHRMAIGDTHKGRGLSSIFINYIAELCLGLSIHSIKVDTHENNKVMQSVLSKNGFSYCGIVYLADGKRLAYERLLP